jgi:hypothetical protein|tara:strand:- start:491 stop:3250 length:2760 start_codon:yes stop_codon:yes gene_type:complete
MSVQLVLYPQSHNGEYNSITTNPTEFIVNGINFVGLNAASSYDSNSILNADILAAAPPTLINTWFRFRYPVGALPALPTVTSGTAVFNSLATLSVSGIYQRMSNLVVGQVYTININVSTTGVGSFGINIFDGNTLIDGSGFTAATAFISTTFTATATDNTFMFFYSSNTAGNVAIEDVSITQESATPSVTLTDGQVICDLYEDEDIPLNLSIDDFKNAAEKVQSYSKAFKLPGTKRNNKIFDNIFEITRANDGIVFNPYNKMQCILKQDGFVLFEGYVRLIDIQDQEGEISYNVNLYSEPIALADYLKEQTFSLLDFTELEHPYNKTQIKYSWNNAGVGITYTNPSTSGFRDANDTLKYPFVNWNNQMLIANGSTGSNATLDFPELTALEQAFRPFIQIKYLIDRIFNQGTPSSPFPFSYTSEFLNTDDFKKLYMDFNWGQAEAPMVFDNSGGLTLILDFQVTAAYSTVVFNEEDTVPIFFGVANPPLPAIMGYSSGVFTAATDGQTYNIDCSLVFTNGLLIDEGVLSCEWLHTFSGGTESYGEIVNQNISTLYTYNANFSVTMETGDTLLFRVINSGGGTSDVEINDASSGGSYDTLVTINTNANQTTDNSLLGTLRGEVNQWNFLKGIMTMFNLVTVPDKSDSNNIIIEPYSDIFIDNTNSVEHNWTDKIDVTEIKLTPLTDLNKKTIFKFVEDDDDYPFNVYKRSVKGHLYGSQEYDASGFSILQGVNEIIAEPFAATVPKPLMTNFADFITPALYSYDPSTGESSGFENSPRILYDNGIKTLTSCTYYIPAQNGLASENQSQFLQFSHLSDIPTVVNMPPTLADSIDFNFGACQLIQPIGEATTKNLFSLYWLPYYNELYNADTRTMTLKVNLTPGDISILNMFDTVFIMNRTFRINNIQYQPTDLSTVEFILIP